MFKMFLYIALIKLKSDLLKSEFMLDDIIECEHGCRLNATLFCPILSFVTAILYQISNYICNQSNFIHYSTDW